MLLRLLKMNRSLLQKANKFCVEYTFTVLFRTSFRVLRVA